MASQSPGPAASASPVAVPARGDGGNTDPEARAGGEGYAPVVARSANDDRTAVPNRVAWLPVAARAGGEIESRPVDQAAVGGATIPDPRIEQVTEVIARGARLVQYPNGDAELRLHLQPDRLGELRIHLVMRDGELNVSLVAANSTAKELIESRLPQLHANLLAQGVPVERFDVSVRAAAEGRSAGNSLAQQQAGTQWAADEQAGQHGGGRWVGTELAWAGSNAGTSGSAGDGGQSSAPEASPVGTAGADGARAEQSDRVAASVALTRSSWLDQSRVDYRV